MQAGARVSHFEIVSVLGRGGMGEVFRARDTKLKRDVALKTLPPEFSASPDRLARFEREATALAALNHPHIASIYGIEEQNGARFLVLELVEGNTLDERLMRGALPLESTLKIALQIASAIEAAHEKGLVHRDLKPANVKITAEGVVKVLDFGLAKDLSSSGAALETNTSFGTDVGLIMGTPPYMSPEQARGETAGKQSDIWSFGVMLYEMLTGLSPFKRDTIPGTLARVLEVQPDYTKLPPSTPSAVRRLLRRCLEKDLKRRGQHIGDVRIELEDALAGDTRETLHEASGRSRWRAVAQAAGAIALTALGSVAAWTLASRNEPVARAETVRLSIASLEAPIRLPNGHKVLALSADGSRVAYTAANRLWVRKLGEPEAVAIEAAGSNPFFSPDGEWIGLLDIDAGISKVQAGGGEPVLVHRVAERVLGASWTPDGYIVFSTTAGLFRIPENGGAAEHLASPDASRGERGYAWPEVLPGARHVLFTILNGESLASAEIASLDLATRAITPIVTGGFAARYAPSGHLVYVVGEALHAIEFDAETLAARGTAVPIPNVTVAVRADNGAAQFAVASNGTLIYMAPRPPAIVQSLVWVDRTGAEEPVPLEPGTYTNPRVSPDGTRVALDVLSNTSRDVWILDVMRSTITRLTTNPAEDLLPLWSADGRRIWFSSNRAGGIDLYSQAADGATEAQLELGGPQVHFANSVTPDGKRVILYEDFRDLVALELGRPMADPLLTGNFDERLGEISPDGRWIAYESDESGEQIEIFVRPFPNVGEQREKVSLAGGRFPRWGRLGSNELYYVALDGAMMAAPIELSPSLRIGRVVKLFDWQQPPTGRSGRPYDISPVDGRFLMTRASRLSAGDTAEIAVVLNWPTELQRAAAAR